MTEFTEPVWVGMDAEAELARMQERERRERRRAATVEEAGGACAATEGLSLPPALLGGEGATLPARLAN